MADSLLSLPASDRRQFERLSTIHLPGIVGAVNFRNTGEALIDIGFGGCRFRYLEDPSFRFFRAISQEFTGLTYITIEWDAFQDEPIVLRARMRHSASFILGNISIFEAGFEFLPSERESIAPLLNALSLIETQ